MSAIPWTVVLAVLAAALLHASWNALVKGGDHVLFDTTMVVAGSSLVTLPLLPWVPAPSVQQWPYLISSVLIHMAYFTALVNAYRFGDLSLGYPIMRGAAPLLVALAGTWLLGDKTPLHAWIGIGLVSVGILALAWRAGHHPHARLAVTFALGNALIIAAYTLNDTAALRLPGSVTGYIVWLFFLGGLPFVAAVWLMHGRALTGHLVKNWHRSLLGGSASAASYGIALWATTQAPVGPVVALRETSVVFAALIGKLLLGEQLNRRRWLGITLVVLGVVAIKGGLQ